MSYISFRSRHGDHSWIGENIVSHGLHDAKIASMHTGDYFSIVLDVDLETYHRYRDQILEGGRIYEKVGDNTDGSSPYEAEIEFRVVKRVHYAHTDSRGDDVIEIRFVFTAAVLEAISDEAERLLVALLARHSQRLQLPLWDDQII